MSEIRCQGLDLARHRCNGRASLLPEFWAVVSNLSTAVLPDARCFWLYCFCDLASRKSFVMGMMTLRFSISVTCVVFGKMANLDSERRRRSP